MNYLKYASGLALATVLLAAAAPLWSAAQAVPVGTAAVPDPGPAAVAGAAAADCTAPASWFSGPSIPVPEPAKVSQFQSNCGFHQYSWQAFLWLTEADKTGQLRFETLYSDRAIHPNARSPRKHVLGGVNQADSHGILVDLNGRAVYTTLLIDDAYRDFVIKNKLYTAAGMQAAPAALVFPVGALSLKATWKIVAAGEDVSRFYITTARIKLLSKIGNGVGIASRPKIVSARVALVGLHIAQVVADHPEAIWATFEHVDNAPDFAPGQPRNAAVSDKSFTFYQAGTTAANCNAGNAGVITLDAATQKLTPLSQACRQFRNGGGNTANVANIDAINASVLAQLPAGSLWKHYREVGAVWFKTSNDLKPDWTPNIDATMVTGSLTLSSAVIETFTQNNTATNSCFSCHNTMSVTNASDITRTLAGKNVSTSHILLQNYLKVSSVKR